MGSFSIWHWLIVLAVVLLLFGRGKIPELMGDVTKGIKNFKKGMSDDGGRYGRPVEDCRAQGRRDEVIGRDRGVAIPASDMRRTRMKSAGARFLSSPSF